MNEVLKGNWNELRGKLKAKWGKLTDNDLVELKGNTQELMGKIQKLYGHTKEDAEKQFKEFKSSL